MELHLGYHCDKCQFSCNTKEGFKAHKKSQLHKNGGEVINLKDVYKCDGCHYKAKNHVAFKEHLLNIHSNKEMRELEYDFYCKYCDFGTFYKDVIEKHTETDKHKGMVKKDQ